MFWRENSNHLSILCEILTFSRDFFTAFTCCVSARPATRRPMRRRPSVADTATPDTLRFSVTFRTDAWHILFRWRILRIRWRRWNFTSVCNGCEWCWFVHLWWHWIWGYTEIKIQIFYWIWSKNNFLDFLPFFWIAVPKSFGKWIAGNLQLCNLKIKIIFNLISISDIWCVHMKSTEILFVWENCFVCLLLMIQNVNRKVWMAWKPHRFSMNEWMSQQHEIKV